MKLNFFLVLFLGCIRLQAATVRRNRYKQIAERFRDYFSNQDPYYGGDNNNNDGQIKISDEDLPKNGELFEGDMVMDDHIRRAVLGLNEKRSAVEASMEGKRRHWPDGVVPYTIDHSLKPLLRKRVAEAIKEFNKYTCIEYVPKKPSHDNWVTFMNGKGCSSSVGRVGEQQFIHLALGCERIGTVIHEMMHAIGIIHEQSRDDRDDYVEVRFDHIKPDLVSNFRKYRLGETVNMDIPYNFFSVMHYSNYAFSADEKATIVSKSDPSLKFGQRVQLTDLDVKQINLLYPCHKKYDKRGLIPDMTERDVEERKRDEFADLYANLF